ncbi:spore germination protein [Clostridiaceae bacterium NSJ-31]|uniref:Spore germination protein n=1 Tax=Ligaoa zhengdingensis TaxID=2763658 RepID=A0A926DX80_9FIRM|nr:spore germination protein [Ligaoa zhengdingensis]MBC8545548.1 spore germination protein [Ligaoa zhengdingensis]
MLFNRMERKLQRSAGAEYVKNSPPQGDDIRLGSDLTQNMINIRQYLHDTADFVNKEVLVCGQRVQLLTFEGMVSTANMTEALLEPLLSLRLENPTPQSLLWWMRNEAVLAPEQKEVYSLGELYKALMSGFVGVLIDGVDVAVIAGIQGFAYRSVSEPDSEVNVRGSREGLVEPIRTNMSLIRRRIKSSRLVFELTSAGSTSKTDLCLCYLANMVSPEILEDVRSRLARMDLDMILDSGYVQPFLDTNLSSLFSNVGVTERPDTVAAKISEGRVVVLVDGTPFALIVPYLFSENFQTLDDYAHRPYYASFIRIMKYVSFFFTILLPGAYVAIASFHPELFPEALLFNIAAAEETTPFPLMFEALIIHIIYEIMREAGLRLPRPIGHAVGIVGGLVIGDAAVTAGLIGAPMVMVVALTAISSFVVPSLYEPVTILRFLFIIVGGVSGLYGITLVLCIVFVNLCAINAYGVPATAPATPTKLFDLRDVLIRSSWKTLGRRTLRVQKLPGSEVGDKGGDI